MATKTRGAPYPLGSDANNTQADLSALAQWVDDRPGVAALTTTAKNALSGTDRWDGKLVLDTTLDRLYRWDAGTTTWIQLPDTGDIASLLATTGTPAALGTASRGVSSSAARADHVHPYSEASGTLSYVTNVAGVFDGSAVHRRDRQVTVHVELQVSAAFALNANIATVPVGFRPTKRAWAQLGSSVAGSVPVPCLVDTAGNLQTGWAITSGTVMLGHFSYEQA